MEEHVTNAVILCGGRSTRMGSAKHRLLFPNDAEPMYRQLLARAMVAYPGIQSVYLSLHDPGSATHLDQTPVMGRTIHLLFDEDGDIGPAAGLLAALRTDSHCTWLVVACDYPLISVAELRRLFASFDGRLTCFENMQGWAEPLLGLWGPEALARLHSNVMHGCTGPKVVVQQLKGKTIRALDDRSLLNTNTPGEWSQAAAFAADMNASSS
ncbi:MobA-like NTP transferase domain-containing protein [Neohortaea acidophila]|uniref:MobA-like NTP transferase domain-containing protein n=1 Tax=Neohortaea acidophila TaxID=245834 RepID=A0A6A6PXH0_9PEZI|nr:MobA-like NTP transferase domain-containing protein [Neohortaea acidophila]KAF2484868.1 MobA-like NTP transferase domain-containing protein [Neohortaea acidophila]